MSRAEEFMMTPTELRLRKEKRRRRVIVAVLIVVVLTAAYFAARPTFRAIKAWQARRHADKAFAFIEQEKWTEARESAVAAYQLRATEPQAIRAVARYLSRTGQQQALEFWDQLEAKQSLNRDDLRDLTEIAIILGDTARAEAALERLLAAGGDQQVPADWLLAARITSQSAEPARAQPYVDKILGDSRSTDRQQFQAALIHAALPSGSAEETQQRRAAVWSRIVKLSRSDSATGLDALLVLAQEAVRRMAKPAGSEGTNLEDTAQNGEGSISLASTPAEGNAARGAVTPSDATQDLPSLPELADAIERHPLAQPMHKLLAVDLRARADPSQSDPLIDGAVAQWKDSDRAGLAALTTWLNGKGQHERVLTLLPLEKALESAETFLQYVDALGGLGRWEEIRRLLENERFPLDPVVQRMYLARTNAQLGQKAASENNWLRAVEAAGAETHKLIMLAGYAEKNGAIAIAEQAYTAAAREAPKTRAAQQGRLRLAQAARDTRKMHNVLSEMLGIWPNDPAVQNDEAYTRLLLTDSANVEELSAIERVAEQLVQRNPASLPHRTLLALARLRQDRPVAALTVYDKIKIAPQSLSPSTLAVHAAVLHANGHTADARAKMQQVPVEALLPEEQSGTAHLR